MSFCPTCVDRQASLGAPSMARWVGPDGGLYCSMHFISRFGHNERLVRVEGYEPPPSPKKPPLTPAPADLMKAIPSGPDDEVLPEEGSVRPAGTKVTTIEEENIHA
jgi:hypothetical protein